MAFTSILRRSASSLAPLASRLARGNRSYHGALVNAINHVNHSYKSTPTPFVPTPRYYSSHSSDQSLLKVIDAEIKCAEETDDLDKAEEIPSGFPFQIEDTPGAQIVTLKRTYQGENIVVEVHMPDLVTGDEENDGDQDGDDEDGSANKSSLPLLVTVSKSDGPSLEFSCTAFADEIEIDSLAVKNPENSEDQIAYEGPDFHDLDENLQKAFHKYLEIRGIKPSTTNFLHEYMINKDTREYANWLQKLKQFVAA